MKKKIIIFVFVLFLCIGAIGGIYCYNKLNKTTYCLNLPAIEDVSRITLEQNAKGIVTSDLEEIKDIINVLNGVKRITKQESIQDTPVNVDNEIKIDFEFKEGGTSTVFVYERNNKYYIEQPYNGIYRISPDEYNSIEKYAGIPNAPSVYAPTKNPDLAKQRQKQVMEKMIKHEYLTQEAANCILQQNKNI